MKKSNLITLLSFAALIVAVIMFMSFCKTPTVGSSSDDTDISSQGGIMTTPSETSDVTISETEDFGTNTSVPESDTLPSETDIQEEITISMSEALFIGDSRTVGLSEYSGINDADFFANVGMSVYNIYKKTLSVPGVGKVTLSELLNNKKYDKIYIMLGINEIGYRFDNIVAKYKELIDFIQEKQPNAVIFIEANLHVGKSRSDSDKVVNNDAINSLNAALSALADGNKIIYIDANTVFDDENGNLSSDKTEDNTHLYAKYYAEWGDWIVKQTASLLGGTIID